MLGGAIGCGSDVCKVRATLWALVSPGGGARGPDSSFFRCRWLTAAPATNPAERAIPPFPSQASRRKKIRYPPPFVCGDHTPVPALVPKLYRRTSAVACHVALPPTTHLCSCDTAFRFRAVTHALARDAAGPSPKCRVGCRTPGCGTLQLSGLLDPPRPRISRPMLQAVVRFRKPQLVLLTHEPFFLCNTLRVYGLGRSIHGTIYSAVEIALRPDYAQLNWTTTGQ